MYSTVHIRLVAIFRPKVPKATRRHIVLGKGRLGREVFNFFRIWDWSSTVWPWRLSWHVEGGRCRGGAVRVSFVHFTVVVRAGFLDHRNSLLHSSRRDLTSSEMGMTRQSLQFPNSVPSQFIVGKTANRFMQPRAIDQDTISW